MAVAGAGLGKYPVDEEADEMCELSEKSENLKKLCNYLTMYRASFALGLIAALLCFGTVALISITFCLEQLAVATKILSKIAMFLGLASLVVALVGMPLMYTDACKVQNFPSSEKDFCNFFNEENKKIHESTTASQIKSEYYPLEMWYCYLVAAVMCAASGIVSFFCRP